jgi:hypothetical protein
MDRLSPILSFLLSVVWQIVLTPLRGYGKEEGRVDIPRLSLSHFCESR